MPASAYTPDPATCVVVTGLGCIGPLGNNVATFWRRLLAGEGGIAPLTRLDTTGLRNHLGGEVRGFDWTLLGEEGDCDEATQYAYAATREAIADAVLPPEMQQQAALVFSTNFAGAASWEGVCAMAADGTVDAELFRQFTPEDAVNYTADRMGTTGPRTTLTNACSSGGNAIGLAVDWVRLGLAPVVIAGGHDGLGLSSLAGLSILRTITADTCRPFDLSRSGTIFGEGAAMVVLERMDHAVARGARIHAVVRGWALNNNAYHLTAPDKEGAGLRSVMQQALQHAGATPQEVDYINAHGTGTQYNDLAETQAIKAVFGDHARRLAVSSIKGATSHTMAAAGAMEAVATVLALEHGTLPPTINYQTPDPECDLDYVPNVARQTPLQVALSNSSGIGGNNCCLVLQRFE